MSIGASEERVLNGTPKDLEPYEKAYKKHLEDVESEAWLYGAYNYTAFSVVMANSFSKGSKKAEYPQQPFFMEDKNNTETEISTKEHANRFMAWAICFNDNFRRKQEGNQKKE